MPRESDAVAVEMRSQPLLTTPRGDRTTAVASSSFASNDLEVTVENTCKQRVYRFVHSPVVQAILIIGIIADLVLMIMETVHDSLILMIATVGTSSILAVELLLRYFSNREYYFVTHKKLKIIEMAIVPTSWLLEVANLTVYLVASEQSDASQVLTYLRMCRIFRWVRLGRVFILWRQRAKALSASVRSVVSQDRRRYQKEGFDLDLTYITDKLIAMSWPSTGFEALYRNHIDDVAAYFKIAHPDHYMIYCLASERRYDHQKFDNRVVRVDMDDHNPVELQSVMDFLSSSEKFLNEDPANVVVVHCKGGKGRTGTVVCCFLLKHGYVANANEALAAYGELRTADGASKQQGVQSPSQVRYVQYVDRMLHIAGKTLNTRYKISSLRLRDFNFQHFSKLERLWFVLLSRPSSDRIVSYQSNQHVTFNPQLDTNKDESRKRNQAFSIGMEQCAVFAVDFGGGDVVPFTPRTHETVSGRVKSDCSPGSNKWPTLVVDTRQFPDVFEQDLVVKFFYDVNNPSHDNAEFGFWVYPPLEDGGTFTIGKAEMDNVYRGGKASRHRSGFQISMQFEPAK